MHDKRKALETMIEKLGKLPPHLGNENDGEALAARPSDHRPAEKGRGSTDTIC
jgi:hypothetical protein